MTDVARPDRHSTDGDSNTALQSIDIATLTPFVRQALGSEMVEVAEWQHDQIYGGGGGISSVHRFFGDGRGQGGSVAWSLILKAIHPQPDSDDPSHWGYWRREALAYESGLLDSLPGGLAAPRCFGITKQSTGELWLWLEEISDVIGPEWPLEHYGIVARHLGRFNGAYLMGCPIPSQPWLDEGWLRRYLDQVKPAVEQLPTLLKHPVGRRALPGDDSEILANLWSTREVFFAALDRLPQTLCHRDAFRRNLFARHVEEGGYETVAIDWAWPGPGAVGEETVSLVLGTLAFGGMELNQAPALDRIVSEGYLNGLRDSGWRGDPRVVRLGFTAGAIRYVPASLWLAATVIPDEEQHVHWERIFGRPLEEVADQIAQFVHFVFHLLAKARVLMERV